MRTFFRGLVSDGSRRLFRFRGGIHPKEHKYASHESVTTPPLPDKLYLPLRQHAGAEAVPIVNEGDRVLGGQLIADVYDAVAAPIHAPTSGRITKIGEHIAPHPSGLPCRIIELEPDGDDTWVENSTPSTDDPESLDPDELSTLIEASGVVGMGGAAFPSAVKLRQARGKVDRLIINGAECEPYLTCDDRLMQESADAIVDGARLLLRTLDAPLALVGIEDNKPAAAAAMRRAAKPYHDVEIVVVPTRFPTGSGKQLVRILTGREVPAGGRSYDAKVVIHNVGTAKAVSDAVRRKRPLVSRIVTIAGGAVQTPQNFEALIGTPVDHLFNLCGLSSKPERMLLGGPMTGQAFSSPLVPIIKGTCGVLALTAAELNEKATGPCIRCGRCVDACPMGLVPLEMASHTKVDDIDGAVTFGLRDCILCGSCSYVCPSHIPLVHYFNYAKGQLASQRAESRRAAEIKQRIVARKERVEQEKRDKAAAAKAMAARRKAKKQAEAKAAAP